MCAYVSVCVCVCVCVCVYACLSLYVPVPVCVCVQPCILRVTVIPLLFIQYAGAHRPLILSVCDRSRGFLVDRNVTTFLQLAL